MFVLQRLRRPQVMMVVSRTKGFRHSSGGQKDNSRRLGETSVFLQTGLKIQELPMFVQKVNDVLQISGPSSDQFTAANESKIVAVAALDEETLETIAGFDRCSSLTGLFKLLETVPAGEVTAPVAIRALKKIVDLENDKEKDKKNDASQSFFDESSQSLCRESCSNSYTFRRIAFVNMLLDIVRKSRDPRAILEGLKILSKDSFCNDDSEQAGSYKQRLAEETLVLVSEGLFSLEQVCEAVLVFSEFYSDKFLCISTTDKLWCGLLDRVDDINTENISAIYRTLPHIRKSRDVVLKLAQDRVEEYWRSYSVRHVLEILGSLTQLGPSTGLSLRKTLMVVTQWLKVNIHTLSESETLAVVYCLHRLEYVDEAVVATMEKYMRVRGCYIRERDLVATLCDYCLDFRVRSTGILEGACEYFIEHGESMTTPQVFSVVRIFGELNFHPTNGFKFFDVVERVLESKFSEFPPKEVLSLLLSFVYIERYPLNFVRRIFNPIFMDRLHSQSPEDVQISQLHLKLLDSALKMEARNYSGPYLPKERRYRTIPRNRQVERVAKTLMEPLSHIVGDSGHVSEGVVLSQLPLHPLYCADIMIYPSVAASMLRFGMLTNNRSTVVVLLHPSEHFCQSFNDSAQESPDLCLIGPQTMRLRHLRTMGFRVMQLKCEQISRMASVFPQKLVEHLTKEYQKATKT